MELNRIFLARPGTASERGFGVVELMIGVVLVSMLVGGLVQLFVSSKQNYSAAANLSRLQETGRSALLLLSEDIRRSGYLGGNSDLATVFGSLGRAAPASNCPLADTSWGRMLEQPMHGLDDVNTGYACITDAQYLRGDVLTTRFASPWVVADGDIEDGKLYLRSTLFEGKVFAGADEAEPANQVTDITSETFELVAHSYFVGPSGRTCDGQAIPSLYRKSLSSAGLPEQQELLPGVEHMQFRYHTGSRYQSADDVADWSAVRAIELEVLVRSECPEPGFSNNRTFAMGDLDTAYGPSDRYRRQLFSTVVAVRN